VCLILIAGFATLYPHIARRGDSEVGELRMNEGLLELRARLREAFCLLLGLNRSKHVTGNTLRNEENLCVVIDYLVSWLPGSIVNAQPSAVAMVSPQDSSTAVTSPLPISSGITLHGHLPLRYGQNSSGRIF
jgi:hypothetical protein